MKGVRITIFHFAPVEYFPPVQNMVNALGRQMKDNDKMEVYTTFPNKNDTLFETENQKISIKRTSNFSLGLPKSKRFISYFKYYLIAFIGSIKFGPSKLLYYETISSLIPIIYKKWIHRNIDLYIHYHEYMTPEEYNGMFLNRILLKLEKKIFKDAQWISHTNIDRLNMFCRDNGYTSNMNIYVLPNYPPSNWNTKKKYKRIEWPLKMVYVGSFGSLKTLFIKEVIKWVSAHSSQISLDIYSNNITSEVKLWIELESIQNVKIKSAIPYQELPNVLPLYDVGLILYKGVNKNFIYNAPNKLFEYLVCGLEVWYPKEMIGIYPYDCITAHPRVVRCDFLRMNEIQLDYFNRLQEFSLRELNYKFEDAADSILQNILCEKAE